jgi:hypothetical protein
MVHEHRLRQIGGKAQATGAKRVEESIVRIKRFQERFSGGCLFEGAVLNTTLLASHK